MAFELVLEAKRSRKFVPQSATLCPILFNEHLLAMLAEIRLFDGVSPWMEQAVGFERRLVLSQTLRDAPALCLVFDATLREAVVKCVSDDPGASPGQPRIKSDAALEVVNVERRYRPVPPLSAIHDSFFVLYTEVEREREHAWVVRTPCQTDGVDRIDP